MDTAPWNRFKSEIYALIARNPRSNRMVITVANLQPEHVVVDIGCGPGAAVRGAARKVARAIGVDRSAPMIDIARRRSSKLDNVAYHVAAAESLPFADHTIDVAWTIHAFHHWEHRDTAIADVLRILSPGGRFLIVESETKNAHGLSRSAADDVASQLEDAGFATAAVAKHHKQLVITAVAG
jgi:ubiquinone/menaquinone biosynthesis C-methylase UbiE